LYKLDHWTSKPPYALDLNWTSHMKKLRLY